MRLNAREVKFRAIQSSDTAKKGSQIKDTMDRRQEGTFESLKNRELIMYMNTGETRTRYR
jgi:hypothetical protein